MNKPTVWTLSSSLAFMSRLSLWWQSVKTPYVNPNEKI